MIDLNAEHVEPLAKAIRHVPTRPHLSTMCRWANQGVNGVKLETVKVGGATCTSREALHRFFERCSNPGEPAACASAQNERAAVTAAARGG